MSVEQRSGAAGERGTVTTLFAVLAIFFFSIVSLVSEGGRKLNNLGRAEDLAAEAARSAAATLDLGEIAQGRAVIDEVDDRALRQAERIVDAVPGAEIERFSITGDRVLVAVRVQGSSWIPGFDLDGVGSHTAVAIDPAAPPIAP